jgi:hypothetical protein
VECRSLDHGRHTSSNTLVSEIGQELKRARSPSSSNAGGRDFSNKRISVRVKANAFEQSSHENQREIVHLLREFSFCGISQDGYLMYEGDSSSAPPLQPPADGKMHVIFGGGAVAAGTAANTAGTAAHNPSQQWRSTATGAAVAVTASEQYAPGIRRCDGQECKGLFIGDATLTLASSARCSDFVTSLKPVADFRRITPKRMMVQCDLRHTFEFKLSFAESEQTCEAILVCSICKHAGCETCVKIHRLGASKKSGCVCNVAVQLLLLDGKDEEIECSVCVEPSLCQKGEIPIWGDPHKYVAQGTTKAEFAIPGNIAKIGGETKVEVASNPQQTMTMSVTTKEVIVEHALSDLLAAVTHAVQFRRDLVYAERLGDRGRAMLDFQEDTGTSIVLKSRWTAEPKKLFAMVEVWGIAEPEKERNVFVVRGDGELLMRHCCIWEIALPPTC